MVSRTRRPPVFKTFNASKNSFSVMKSVFTYEHSRFSALVYEQFWDLQKNLGPTKIEAYWPNCLSRAYERVKTYFWIAKVCLDIDWFVLFFDSFKLEASQCSSDSNFFKTSKISWRSLNDIDLKTCRNRKKLHQRK